jgi:hypothetical protein
MTAANTAPIAALAAKMVQPDEAAWSLLDTLMDPTPSAETPMAASSSLK